MQAIEEPLLCFIFEMRKQGMAVSHFMIVLKAASLSADFAAKSYEAQKSAVRRFVGAHPNNQYHCQDAAWMDETVMLAWVEGPLKAPVEQAPDGIIPLLVLDSYRCHMMASVVNRIQEMGVEVIHFPLSAC